MEGYLVAEVTDCSYRGIDRMPSLDPEEFMQLSPQFGLTSDEWLSASEADGREFHGATEQILPGRTLELIFVSALEAEPEDPDHLRRDGLTFLGLDVAHGWSPYESVLNHWICYDAPSFDTPIPLNANGLIDSFELADRVRQQSHERLHTDWERADYSVWAVWRVEER